MGLASFSVGAFDFEEMGHSPQNQEPRKMRITLSVITLVGFALSACSEADMPLITAEPTFDKYGSASGCEDGFVLMTEGQYVNLCLPVNEGCTEDYNRETEQCRPYRRTYDENGGNTPDYPDDSTTEDRYPDRSPQRDRSPQMEVTGNSLTISK